MTGISSRATNGNVTNAVARISPGVAKMILRLWFSRPDLEVLLQRRTSSREHAPRRRRARPATGMLPHAAPRLGSAGRKQQHSSDEQRRRASTDDQVRHDRVAVPAQALPEVALQAEDQHEHQPGHDRRDRERQVDQRGQQRPARETEAGDRPGRRDAEDEVGDDRDRARRSASAGSSAACRGRRPGCPSRRRRRRRAPGRRR